MSWDISLTDRVTGEVLHSDSPHMMRGGTFMLGGIRNCAEHNL